MIRLLSLCVCAAALAACDTASRAGGAYAPAPADVAGSAYAQPGAAPAASGYGAESPVYGADYGAAPTASPTASPTANLAAAPIPGVRYVDESGSEVGPPPAAAPPTSDAGVETYASEEEARAAAAAAIVRAEVPPPSAPSAAAPTRAPVREVVSTMDTRRQIWIVGDAPMVEDAETILNIKGFPDLKTDGNGSDAGVAAFCSGVGYQAPDMVAIARPLNQSEQAVCERNGVSFNSIGALDGFIAVKDAHMALVPNLSDAFDALVE